MPKAGETGMEIISSLIISVPFQKMSIFQRIDFLDRTFGVKVSAADIMECGDNKDRIIELILNHRK